MHTYPFEDPLNIEVDNMDNELTTLLEKKKYGVNVGPVHTILNSGALISAMNNSLLEEQDKVKVVRRLKASKVATGNIQRQPCF